MRKHHLYTTVLSVLAAVTIISPDCGAFTLVQDAAPQAVLVVSKDVADLQAAQADVQTKPAKGKAKKSPAGASALQDEVQAVTEIQSYVEKISGAKLAIVAAGSDLKGLKPIYIGGAADDKMLDAIKAKGTDDCSFSLIVDDAKVSLRGLSPAGTYCGACELLEQLGVRWFMPGPLGTIIPQAKTVTLKTQQTIQIPSFPSRYLQAVAVEGWDKHLRAGGLNFPGAHGVHLSDKGDKLFAEHPEYFSLIGGKRVNKQLCISNPDVLRLAITTTKEYFKKNPGSNTIGMGANDGRGFCECENCKKLDAGDYDQFGHCESMTDRYVWFFNQVLDGIKDEYPKGRIAFYAYASYCRPPVKVKPDPKIVPAVAMITLCRIHGVDNPVCPEKSYEKEIIQAWGKIVPEVYYRGYWFNLADPGLPFFMNRRIAQEVPLGKQLGIVGWRTECMTNWAGSSPSFYLALKLMWDKDAKMADILADFAEKFFGPAAAPMAKYIDLMDRVNYEADYHTGCIWDMTLIYNPRVRKEARKLLDEAIKAAPAGSDYAKRVDMYNTVYSMLEGYVDVMDGRTVCDFTRAKKGLETMKAAAAKLSPPSMDPTMITKQAALYIARFVNDPVTQGFARTTGGNKLLAAMNDTWQFQIDPEKVGEIIGLWKPSVIGGNWQTLKTSTASWSDQGLRYYKGLAWYRQNVDIPADAKGKRVFLWFAGIDERAKVWVNGKEVGISPAKLGAFKPFELDATDAIEAGKPNVVVVCISNEKVDELGTGGITGPVMFYLPAAGKDAKLENGGTPAKTFPEY